MQFLVPRREGLAQLAVGCAYMTGHDGVPWESRVVCTNNRLTVTRAARESGRLVTPWTVPAYGSVALSTATLLPRDEPYQLVLELCRGTLARIHNQIDADLLERADVKTALSTAEAHFIQAALRQDDIDQSAHEAEMSLAICLDLIRQCLGQVSIDSDSPAVFSSRLTGIQVSGEKELEALNRQSDWLGNALFYQSSWRETESNPGQWDWRSWKVGLSAAQKARRRVVCGPLFRLRRPELPDWLYLWDDDFDTLQSYVCSYIQATVQHLQQHVNVWYVTAGTNVDTELHLGEEQRLRLTLASLEALRKVDAQTPAIIGIKQPWGEYLGRSTADLLPVQFADIIVRSGLGASGFALEMNLACATGRTLPRDLLELSRLLDQWSHFGVPIVVVLSLPTPSETGPKVSLWQRHLRDMLTLMQQKSSVQGIIWSELMDDSDWSGGLLREDSQPKPIWHSLRELWHGGPSAG